MAAAPLPRTTDAPLRGIALMLGAGMCFSASDALAKFLGAHLPPTEIAWVRYVVFVGLAVVILKPRRHYDWRSLLQVRSPALQLVRGLCLMGSSVFFIAALRGMPLADAAALGFVSPLLVTMLSPFMLGEKVGPRRWAAVLVGFAGVLVVARPGGGTLAPAALLVLGSALSWALASVLTRKVATTDDPAVTLLWSAVSGLIVLTFMLGFELTPLDAQSFLLLLALGLVSSTGQYLIVLAHRHAGSSLLAPFSYAQLIWSTTLGYLVFGAFPDRWTLVGAVIIIASGIYTAHRERVRMRQRA